MKVSRRDFLIACTGTACGCAVGWELGAFSRPTANGVPPVPPSAAALAPGAPGAQRALQMLMDGNRRFAEGHPIHPHESREWRASVAKEQHPYAVILGCSDSRVSPEVVFDEGLGELFVVRQAGHVADDDTLGSIEYAVGHLHVPLVVVLGHQNCGAVEAAIGAVVRDEPAEGHILRLVDDIAPAVAGVRPGEEPVLDAVVRANVQHVVRRLRASGPVLRPRERKGEVRIVGAYYPLLTGVVEWLAT